MLRTGSATVMLLAAAAPPTNSYMVQQDGALVVDGAA
jgi:hypothetical protein